MPAGELFWRKPEHARGISFAVGAPLGDWTISAMGQAFQTGGYILVPPNQRGSVDTNANVPVTLREPFRSATAWANRVAFFVRGSGFRGEPR